MKKTIYLLLANVALCHFTLNAQVDIEDIGSETIAPPAEEEQTGPFKIDLAVDCVGKARVRKSCPGGHLNFAYAQAEFNFIYYYDPCYKEGAAASLAYQYTHLDWNRNPYFHQKNYNTIDLLFSGFTERFDDWQWRGQVGVSFDNIEHWNFQDYMYYDFLLWGRYAYCDNIGLHIGFLAQTGMKVDRVYPIVGIDWKYDSHWSFNAIYPLNFSVIYNFDCDWSVALASRLLDQRHRADDQSDDLFPRAVWHYQTSGGELALNYHPGNWMTANVHVGYSFGGHLTIANRHYHHRHRMRIDSAPYAGAEVAMRF